MGQHGGTRSDEEADAEDSQGMMVTTVLVTLGCLTHCGLFVDFTTLLVVENGQGRVLQTTDLGEQKSRPIGILKTAPTIIGPGKKVAANIADVKCKAYIAS